MTWPSDEWVGLVIEGLIEQKPVCGYPLFLWAYPQCLARTGWLRVQDAILTERLKVYSCEVSFYSSFLRKCQKSLTVYTLLVQTHIFYQNVALIHILLNKSNFERSKSWNNTGIVRQQPTYFIYMFNLLNIYNLLHKYNINIPLRWTNSGTEPGKQS